MRTHGFTLVELLTVIALIALLAALLLPVVVNSRKRAQIGQCISQLHQIGQAIQMYRSDHDQFLPEKLVETRSYIKSDSLFICPADPLKGRGLIGLAEGIPTRYWTILEELSHAARGVNTSDPDVRAAQILMEQDPNHGIAVCFLHGEKEKEADSEDPILGDYMGLMLRLRLDASVQSIHIDWVCTSSDGGGVIDGTIPGWFLYTDVRPCPDSVPPEAHEIDCPPRENVVPCP